MDWDDVVLPFALTVIMAVAAFVMALKSLLDSSVARAQLVRLNENYRALDAQLGRLLARVDQLAAPSGETAPEAEPVPPPEPVVPEPPPAAAEPASPGAQPLEAATPQPATQRWDWERLLVENWLVWLGGATLALGGAFLVKLSIDYGLLIPPVRVALGVLMGIVLSVAGEWLLRRERVESRATIPASYVPQALAAAGAATVFASLYAAYQLYDLLPAGPAFGLLAATAAATVAQSLRQGPYVAALGLIGAYIVPLLVTSEAPHALPLFGYLLLVTAASLALLRHREWWWLAWLSLVGSLLWVPVWLGGVSDPEAPVVALYLIAQFALFIAFRRGIARIGFLAGVAEAPIVRIVTRAAFWVIAFAVVIVANADGFGLTSVGAGVAMTIGLMVLAYRDSRLDDVIAVAGALALALLASWHLPLPTSELTFQVFKLDPDHVERFAAAAFFFTTLFGAVGFVLLPSVARPGRWAALSAAAPLAIGVIAYWRLQQFDLDIAWSIGALALAGLELGAAATLAQRRTGSWEIEIALAAYAVGVLGSTIFAATLALGNAWLTVAFSLHLPAMGWIESRIRLPALRWLALGVAIIVLVRLVLNPYVLEYPLGPTPIFNWLLYGYGVPAAAFIVATRQFGSSKDDALVWTLEAGSILFTFLLLTLETIHAIFGRLTADWADDFASGACLIALWFAVAAALVALGEFRQRPVLRWGGRLLLGSSTLFAVLWQFVMLLFGVRVGDLPILDALLLADAVPALSYAAVAWLNPTRPIYRMIARIFAAAFAFAWVTLEIRHLFQGKVELFIGSSEAEWYAYSVAWLVFAGVTLALGLLRGNEWLRRVGLIGLGLVIGKVFLSDMGELSGVLRALSFIGLGLALVAIGYAYRRLRPVQPQPEA